MPIWEWILIAVSVVIVVAVVVVAASVMQQSQKNGATQAALRPRVRASGVRGRRPEGGRE